MMYLLNSNEISDVCVLKTYSSVTIYLLRLHTYNGLSSVFFLESFCCNITDGCYPYVVLVMKSLQCFVVVHVKVGISIRSAVDSTTTFTRVRTTQLC